MDYKVLYRKYRPQDFDSVVGQEYTTKLLKNAINENKISHAYIFTGPRGTGKTSTAKIFAKAINCTNPKDGNPCNKCDLCTKMNENPDIVEIDAASNNGVDDIRELIENSRLTPSISKYKVYIIDEFHMLSTSAFNALLLTLEEPTKNVVFILATTDIQSVPITVLSRCQRFDFKPISNEIIKDRLKYVCKQEKIEISDDAINEIAYMSNGGLRDALSILDQVSSNDKKIEVDDIVENFGSVSNKNIEELIKYYSEKKVDKMLDKICEFKKKGVDYRILSNKLINLLKNELVNIRLNDNKFNLDFDDIYNLIFELSKTLSNTKNTVDPYIFIEIILLKYVGCDDNNLVLKNKNKDENYDEPKENIDEKEVIIKDSSEKNNKEIEEKSNVSNTNKCSFSIDVRVNNCFVNAKKEFLNNIKEKWNDFLIYESNANKTIMSYIADTDIVTASDNYAILVNNQPSTAELINEKISSLEKDFNVFYGMKYRFVCLDDSKWKECKEKYILNIKNHVKYSIIDEVDDDFNSLSNFNEEKSDELEKLAAEIFDDNVEIK